MKAILKFDLDDHFDRLEHRRCLKADDCYMVFNKIFEEMLKNGDAGKGEMITLEAFDNLLEEYNINLEDLP